MGELVGGGELARIHAERMLLDAGRAVRLPESEVRRTVRRGLNHGEQKPRRAPEGGTMLRDRAEAVEAVIGWWSAVTATDWHGARAATDLRILAGFALLAMRAGKVRLAESYREVAEAAGVSVGTITKHRMALAKWVRRVECGSRFKTGTRSVWQLVGRATGNKPASPARDASGMFPSARTITDPAHPLWHRWSTGWRIACLLDPGEVSTVRSLASVTGLHPGSVRRLLARLAAEGVAASDGDGGWTLTDPGHQVDTIVDFVAERRAMHRAQRIVHRAWLAQLCAHPPPRRRAPREPDQLRAAA